MGIQNANPAMNINIAMNGNVVSKRFLLPKVSIVQIAGSANTQLMAPKPNDARKADC